METFVVHTPADRAPVTGMYELLSPGGATGEQVRVPVFEGTSFPAVPLGWHWRLAGTRLSGD